MIFFSNKLKSRITFSFRNLSISGEKTKTLRHISSWPQLSMSQIISSWLLRLFSSSAFVVWGYFQLRLIILLTFQLDLTFLSNPYLPVFEIFWSMKLVFVFPKTILHGIHNFGSMCSRHGYQIFNWSFLEENNEQ